MAAARDCGGFVAGGAGNAFVYSGSDIAGVDAVEEADVGGIQAAKTRSRAALRSPSSVFSGVRTVS